MVVQSRNDVSNVPFIRSGESFSKNNEIIFTDAGRVIPLVFGTVMAKIAATQKWVPFTDETAVDGSGIPQGIFIGSDIAAADIAAGDVEDQVILTGGACTLDAAQLVIENSKTLATVIPATTAADNVNVKVVEDCLADKGLYIEQTVDIDGLET